jgi:hypothetical protein
MTNIINKIEDAERDYYYFGCFGSYDNMYYCDNEECENNECSGDTKLCDECEIDHTYWDGVECEDEECGCRIRKEYETKCIEKLNKIEELYGWKVKYDTKNPYIFYGTSDTAKCILWELCDSGVEGTYYFSLESLINMSENIETYICFA